MFNLKVEFMKRKLTMFLALFLISIGIVTAQIQVRGTVVDEQGEPLIGATVQIKGTAQGTVTDANGNFTLSAPATGTLVVSYVGYQTQEVGVRANVRVQLQSESELLEDVIIVAYGTVTREAKTGAVATVSTDAISSAPVASVDRALGGKLAGVMVTSTTGQPGGTSQIRIRGTSSLNASNEPLWVIDGIPVMSGDQSYFTNTSNAMAAVNPNDIESITVLKDAAAASIYGSRAANGVILVTTKSGKRGEARFTARAKFGSSKLANDNNFGVLSPEQLLDYFRNAATNSGYDPDSELTKTGAKNPYYFPKSILDKPMTNWLDEFTRSGSLREYEINASGGTERSKFYTSFSYQKNEGVFHGVDFQKYTARANADHKLTKNLELGTRINLANSTSNDVAMQSLYYVNPIFAGLRILPWTPFRDDDGNYNTRIPENSNTNPLYSAYNDQQWEKQYRGQGSFYLQWTPIKNLTLKTNNAVEGTFGEGRRWWAPDPGGTTGTLQTSKTQNIRLTTSNTATYNLLLEDHSLRLMAGQEAMRDTYHAYYVYAPDISAKIPFLSAANADTDDSSYGESASTMLSYFGMLDYNYATKYFLQASLRSDGSSLFGADNIWGLFWSLSASWNISNENFMKATKDWLSLLKLRASYGINGNNGIAAYRAYGVYAPSTYAGAIGMLPSRPENSNLSWEKNNTWNLGLDASFLKERVNLQVDVYNRKTVGMLLDKQVPQTSGFSSNFMNIGSLNNKGVEIQLNGDIIRQNDWNWNVGANIAFNKTKILDLGDTEEMNSSDSRIKHKVGMSFYTFYLKDYYGVNPSNGEALYWTEDNTLTNNYNKARYVYSGSPEPKFTGGLNTNLSWKGLSLGAFMEFKYGNKVMIVENRYLFSDGNQMSTNHVVSALNYWKQPGDTGVSPKPFAGNATNSYHFSTNRWIEDGSFLRIKDITLSYDLPNRIVKDMLKLNGLRFYLSGLNIYTFHDVAWFDPERGVMGMGAGIYPQSKTFIGGIELSF